MIRERAREPVDAWLQAEVQDLALAGKRLRQPVHLRAPDPLESEVVLVLAEVGQLDSDSARRHAHAREPVVELEGDDLDAAERSGRLRRHRAREGKADEQERKASHLSNGTRAKEPACGMILAASVPSHCSSTEQ